jgi:hypothetical protein
MDFMMEDSKAIRSVKSSQLSKLLRSSHHALARMPRMLCQLCCVGTRPEHRLVQPLMTLASSTLRLGAYKGCPIPSRPRRCPDRCHQRRHHRALSRLVLCKS